MMTIRCLTLLGIALNLPSTLAQDTNRHWTMPSPPATDWSVVAEVFRTNGYVTQLPERTDWGTVPTNNMFITDLERHIGGRLGLQGVVRTETLLKALSSADSRPAEQYPEGNWGEPVGGLQLSIRFAKPVFTNGEPVVAIVLLRNVSGGYVEWPHRYLENLAFSVTGPDGKDQPSPERELRILGPGYYRFERNSQGRFEIRLDAKFNFQQPGSYTVRVSTETRPTGGKPLRYPLVSSGKAVIEIAKP